MTIENFQGTHILGASRGCLCDSSAFLLWMSSHWKPRDAAENFDRYRN